MRGRVRGTHLRSWPLAPQVTQAELKKLRRMNEQQPGYSSMREHLEWIADLPWSKV